MSDRLPARLVVAAMLRRANDAGGFGAVLAKGDPQAGAVLVVARERGGPVRLLERGIGPDGRPGLIDSTPADDPDGYLARRRNRDPDLWVIELDVPDSQRLAAESLAVD